MRDFMVTIRVTTPDVDADGKRVGVELVAGAFKDAITEECEGEILCFKVESVVEVTHA